MFVLLARFARVGHRGHVLSLAAAFIALVTVGGGSFAVSQGLSLGTGLYWAVTTATTVGYGDVTPHNTIGRVLASLLMLTAIPVLGALFAVLTGASLASGIRRIVNSDSAFPSGDYRLVVGTHPTIPAVLTELVESHHAVVLVSALDPGLIPDAVHVITGSPTDAMVIGRARPAGAEHALIAGETDGDVLVSAVLVHQLAPGLPITALTNGGSVRDALRALGVEQTVSVDALVAHTLAKSLEAPHTGTLLEELIDSDDSYLIEIPVESATVGLRLSAVREHHDGLVLGRVHENEVDLGIGADPVLVAGDQLIVAVSMSSARHS